jgi:hypothetical protein
MCKGTRQKHTSKIFPNYYRIHIPQEKSENNIQSR